MIRVTDSFYCPARTCRGRRAFTTSTSLKRHQQHCPAFLNLVLESNRARDQLIQTREARLEEERIEAQRLKDSEIQMAYAPDDVRISGFIYRVSLAYPYP